MKRDTSSVEAIGGSRRKSRGTSGAGLRRSTDQKATPPATVSTTHTSVGTLATPHDRTSLATSSSGPTATASVTAPGRSKRASRRGVSRSSAHDATAGRHHQHGLDEEQHLPADRVDRRGPDRQADDRGPGGDHRPPAHRPGPALAVVHAVDQRQRAGHRARPRDLGQGAEEDQGEGRRRRRAQRGEHDRHRVPDDEHPAMTVEVAQLAEDRQGQGRRDHRQGHDPRQARLVDPEVVGDRRQGQGQDRDREGRREQPRQRDEQHGARVAAPPLEGVGPPSAGRPGVTLVAGRDPGDGATSAAHRHLPAVAFDPPSLRPLRSTSRPGPMTASALRRRRRWGARSPGTGCGGPSWRTCRRWSWGPRR